MRAIIAVFTEETQAAGSRLCKPSVAGAKVLQQNSETFSALVSAAAIASSPHIHTTLGPVQAKAVHDPEEKQHNARCDRIRAYITASTAESDRLAAPTNSLARSPTPTPTSSSQSVWR
jgi:hypothetical protein